MYNVIINIIAWIGIIWFISIVFWHIMLHAWFKIKHNDCEYFGIKRTTYFSNTEYDYWYIIPTIAVLLKGKYKEITISWLKWSLSMSYHLFTDEEDSIEATIRNKMREEENSK